MEMIKDRKIKPLLDLIDANKQVVGLQGQREKHEQTIRNITSLLKDLKANRNKTLKQIVGGNLIVEVEHRDAIKKLNNYKEELNIGLKGLDEQLMHRKDNLEGAVIRAYKMLRQRVPEDILKEFAEGN